MNRSVLSRTLKFVLAVVLFTSTAFSNNSVETGDQLPIFKIIPTKESKELGIYIGFKILPDDSVWFYECQQNNCRPIFDRAFPKGQFEALLKKVTEKAANRKKAKPWREFLIGAGVTHIGAALLAGIAGTIASLGTYTPVKDGVVGGLAYLFSPAATAAVAMLGVGGGEGAMAAAFFAAGGAAIILIAVLGGLGYAYYKSKNKSDSQDSVNFEADHTLEMNVTKAEIMAMLLTMSQGVNATPLLIMP